MRASILQKTQRVNIFTFSGERLADLIFFIVLFARAESTSVVVEKDQKFFSAKGNP